MPCNFTPMENDIGINSRIEISHLWKVFGLTRKKNIGRNDTLCP